MSHSNFIQDGAMFTRMRKFCCWRRLVFLFAGSAEQYDGFQFELSVCAACADDGYDVPRQQRDVARNELAVLASHVLFLDYWVGDCDHGSELVGSLSRCCERCAGRRVHSTQPSVFR